MDERSALRMLGETLPHAGDDAAVVDGQVVTTDMLHETTDFPDGTTRYTAGWRAVGASLSDVAAMGADATSAVAVYAAPEFDDEQLGSFVAGASDVCESVDAAYVGGDLDQHVEFTVATTALGETDDPVLRSGAEPGDAICVTGALGRSAAGFRYFQRGVADGEVVDPDALDRANDLFQFPPRVCAGQALVRHASAMMDSSDGLARSLHQLAEASGCGVAIDSERLPIHEAIDAVADDAADRLELGAYFGEDFELVCTIPADDLDAARDACPGPLTPIGEVVDADPGDAGALTMDDAPLPDRGYTHGG